VAVTDCADRLLEVPDEMMQIAAEGDDAQLRRLVGKLASEVVMQVMMDLKPYLRTRQENPRQD
jgi:hypothetical protein